MAITKLMNIKQGSNGTGRHLKNSIEYIMNPKKTENGKLIGGNAGVIPQEVYQVMVDTKIDWEKIEGRQGYHFVISFAPKETDEETAYQILQEFCESYFADAYDYVFAIHNDQNHMHGHIIFNSVNRISGYKYRYEKGDWEKYIQPITDEVCKKYDLSPLEFENEKRKGKSYAEWEAEKNKKPTWKKIIRADIDYVISISEDEEGFVKNLKQMGYEVRKGYSEKHGFYFAFRAKEQNRAWRSYNLGDGYNYKEIIFKLSQSKIKYSFPKSPKIKISRIRKVCIQKTIPEFQKKRIRKIYFLTYRQRKMKSPYAVDYQTVRKSLLHIDRLWEGTTYLLQHHITSYDALLQKEEELKKLEKMLKNQKYSTDFLQEDETYLRYINLKKKLEKTPSEDDEFEKILDEIEALEKELPDAILNKSTDQNKINELLNKIREEKRIIRQIKHEEEENKLFNVEWQNVNPRQQQEEKERKTQWEKSKKVMNRQLI